VPTASQESNFWFLAPKEPIWQPWVRVPTENDADEL